MAVNQTNVFWIIVISLYVAAITLSYFRIYVWEAYPTFYSEEEMPDSSSEIYTVFGTINL